LIEVKNEPHPEPVTARSSSPIAVSNGGNAIIIYRKQNASRTQSNGIREASAVVACAMIDEKKLEERLFALAAAKARRRETN
jgi:hypothetical protein